MTKPLGYLCPRVVRTTDSRHPKIRGQYPKGRRSAQIRCQKAPIMKQTFLLTILTALLLISCQQEPPPMPTSVPTATIAYMNGPFTPSDGKMLFIIGQDVESVEAYNNEAGPVAGGFTEYTSLDRLEGITRRTDYSDLLYSISLDYSTNIFLCPSHKK